MSLPTIKIILSIKLTAKRTFIQRSTTYRIRHDATNLGPRVNLCPADNNLLGHDAVLSCCYQCLGGNFHLYICPKYLLHREKERVSHPYKGKVKVVPLRSIEAHLGDRRYSSYSFLTSALEGGEWSASRPGRALLPGKEPSVPIVQEAGWAPEPVWTQRLEEKSYASVGD
jgi:hypothetical protein